MRADQFIGVMACHLFHGFMPRLTSELDRLQTKDRPFAFETAGKFQAMKNTAAPAVHDEKRRSRTAVVQFDEREEFVFRPGPIDQCGQARNRRMGEEIVNGKLGAKFRFDPDEETNGQERIAAEMKKRVR